MKKTSTADLSVLTNEELWAAMLRSEYAAPGLYKSAAEDPRFDLAKESARRDKSDPAYRAARRVWLRANPYDDSFDARTGPKIEVVK